MDSEKKLKINDRQKEFYNSKKKNRVTKIWSYFRNGILNKIRKDIGVEQQLNTLHKQWCGDLSSKKVLDLGCYEGNSLSYYLAANSKRYVAIDLSDIGIKKLKEKIDHLSNAEAFAIDFLSDDFKEQEFDLIYAYGVLHHFKDTDALIERLKEKLSPNGEIISHDPLQTSIPVKMIRTLYRPFQSDRDWEWPFTRNTFRKYEKAFDIVEKRGMLGQAKWFFIVDSLPISKEKKESIGKKWHREDWEKSNNSYSRMFSCMHLTMLMRKKN